MNYTNYSSDAKNLLQDVKDILHNIENDHDLSSNHIHGLEIIIDFQLVNDINHRFDTIIHPLDPDFMMIDFTIDLIHYCKYNDIHIIDIAYYEIKINIFFKNTPLQTRFNSFLNQIKTNGFIFIKYKLEIIKILKV